MAKVSAQRTLAALLPALLLALLPATIARAQSDPHAATAAEQAVGALSTAAPLDVQARIQMGRGDSRGALQLMRAHVVAHSDDRAARFDLVRYLTWSGNYAQAEGVLRADPDAERSPEGQQLHAGLLAWAGRIETAQALNAPLLSAHPDDFLANYTQAIALRQSAKPRAALPYVEAVQRSKPGSDDANGLELGTRVLSESFIALDYDHASDSDHLVSSRPTLRAELAQGDALRYTIELGRWENRSPSSSPFAAVDGAGSVAQDRGLFGLRYASSLATVWSAALGYSSISNSGALLWRAGVDHRAEDDWRLGLQLDHDRLAVSPRSLSLGLTRTGAVGQIHWTPDMLWTGDILLRDDHYSDSNNSVEWDAALRRAVVRHSGVMLDLGAQLQHISYDRNPGNGYYAPSDYRRYALTANAYFGLGKNVGLSLQGALGRQRDETFTSWRRADDISAAVIFGIFTPWQLRAYAGYSERVQNTGAYAGRNWGMTLTRRF